MKVVVVDIKKPLFGNYVYIASSFIEKAIKEKVMLGVIIPNGRALVDPVKWKENGKVMKKVFKFKDNPMILYGGYVPLPTEEKGTVIKKEYVDRTENPQTKMF